MVMVILGGMGSLFGPAESAPIVYLSAGRNYCRNSRKYWAMIMGSTAAADRAVRRGGGIMGAARENAAVGLIPCSASTNLVRRFGGHHGDRQPSRLEVPRGELARPSSAPKRRRHKTTLISPVDRAIDPRHFPAPAPFRRAATVTRPARPYQRSRLGPRAPRSRSPSLLKDYYLPRSTMSHSQAQGA